MRRAGSGFAYLPCLDAVESRKIDTQTRWFRQTLGRRSGVTTLSGERESTPDADREEQLARFGARVRKLREKARAYAGRPG
ncbi:hypothetical protein SAMN05661080_03670 [Modestobacter sp. DSM 44400]|nr:hypothetical protein SAMN05661080_03670 [Modestobacter sp. DSM 44400]